MLAYYGCWPVASHCEFVKNYKKKILLNILRKNREKVLKIKIVNLLQRATVK
jgi:hypothetical protein